MQKYLEKFVAAIIRNKRVFVFALLLVVLFSIFPPAHAEAIAPLILWGGVALVSWLFGVPVLSDIISDAAKPFLQALTLFINVVIATVTSIVQGFYIAIGEVLHAVITYFTTIPINQPFVQEAFDFTRGFVNMLFILILVFIGLATILRLQAYQMQKTLPIFIIIALLVNFSGVLVGFIADIGNILTNIFLNASEHAAYSTNPWGGSPVDAAEISQNIARILFFVLGNLIYFLVMLLFGVRVIILWTLTILAPLAFAALILPATKSLWAKWWSALIQWSIIGIPISFFLFLAGSAMSWNPPAAQGINQTISAVFAPFTALLLLFIGITLSMQMAPAGAQGVINFAKKLPKRITETRLGAKAAAWGASKTQGALSGIAPGLDKLAAKGGIGGGIGKALKFSGFGIAAKGANRLAGGKLLEYAASKRRMTLPKNFDQMSEEELEAWTQANNVSGEDLVQFAARMQDKKKYKHTTQAFKDRVNEAAENVSSQRWLHPDLGALKDVVPETVTRKLLEDMVVLEKAPESKTEEEALRKKFRESIAEEADKLSEEAGKNAALQEQVDIEAGLNQKIVTRNEVSADRTAALAKARTQLSDAQKRSALEDLAAAKMYAVDLKPGDISNILNPTSLAFSLAVPDANPETLHRLFASFEKDKVEKVLNTPGGLNDRSNTKEKLIELQKSNPRLTRAIFNSSGYQHIDLEARRVLREEFHNKPDELMEAVEPPKVEPPKVEPMPFKTNDITNEIKARQQELAQLANRKKATPTLYTAGREQRLLDEINRLNQDLLHEQLEEQMIESMSTAKRVRDFLKKRYEEQYRNQINQQLNREASFLQTAAARMGKPVEDITKKRRKELFVRDMDAEVTQSHLPTKITAANRAVFQEVLDKKQISTNPSQLAGALHTLLENIQDAEKRINANPTVTQIEWRNLGSMKRRYNEIRRELRRAGTKIVP